MVSQREKTGLKSVDRKRDSVSNFNSYSVCIQIQRTEGYHSLNSMNDRANTRINASHSLLFFQIIQMFLVYPLTNGLKWKVFRLHSMAHTHFEFVQCRERNEKCLVCNWKKSSSGKSWKINSWFDAIISYDLPNVHCQLHKSNRTCALPSYTFCDCVVWLVIDLNGNMSMQQPQTFAGRFRLTAASNAIFCYISVI